MKRSSSSVVHEDLFRAVRKGRLSDVEVLVNQGADIRALFVDTYPHGTVMHVAAEYGHQHLLEFFVNKGLDINSTYRDNRNTPLHLASQAGRAEVVQFLLEQNADMHAVNMQGRKPIHVAVEYRNKDVLQIFLNTGMDVQEAYGKGSTLLHLCCEKGNFKVAQLLVHSKADIHARDAVGRKPIHVAAFWGRKNFVEYFLKLGMGIDDTDKHGQTALHLAAKEGHLKVIRPLVARITAKPQLNAQDNEGKTPMHMSYATPDILNYLLDAGARSDIKDHDGRTALFYFMNDRLSVTQYPPVSVTMRCNSVDIETRMITRHSAEGFQVTDFIKLVFQNQKNLNVEDRYGETPMNCLTRNLFSSFIHKYEALIRMFVDHGAYLKAVDCERIVRSTYLKEELFTDEEFCSQYLINKFDNIDLPMLGKLPSAIPPSVLEKLKLKNCQISLIERAVEEEIQNEGHCDVSKMVPPLLSMLAIESYISHYCTS